MAKYDVLTIGNAIVDIIARCDDSFLEENGIIKGAMNLSEGSQPERVNSVFMTASMFQVLGVPPLLGQTFREEHDVPNAEPVAVLSYELWQRNFGGDPAIVGKQLQIQGRSRMVLGVMPPGFDLHDARVHERARCTQQRDTFAGAQRHERRIQRQGVEEGGDLALDRPAQ